MYKAIVASVLALVLAGCGYTVEHRDQLVDRAAERWCGLTEAEKQVVADRREYSDRTVEYLEGFCD